MEIQGRPKTLDERYPTNPPTSLQIASYGASLQLRQFKVDARGNRGVWSFRSDNAEAKIINLKKEDAVKHLISSIAVAAMALAISSSAWAQTRITLLSPDPLKREVDKIVQDFVTKTGIKVQESYGTGVGTR